MTPLLTVFTPTYNRAHTLPCLYESLCRQSCRDFLWSIVDDGSTDGTGDLVRKWISEGRIPIIYRRQPNSGKMRSHNAGASNCSTALFFCIDSDDFAPDTLVASISGLWPSIENEADIAGFIAYKSIKDEAGDYQVKCRFPERKYSSLSGLYDSGFYGDAALVFKTSVLKNFPFLEIPGEKFSTEAYAYDRIDREYKYLLVDDVWTLCAYLPDGYTSAEKALYRDNPRGWALFYNQRVKFSGRGLSKAKIGYAILYMIFARRSGIKDIYRTSELKTPLYPLLWLMSYYYEWKWREKYPK